MERMIRVCENRFSNDFPKGGLPGLLQPKVKMQYFFHEMNTYNASILATNGWVHVSPEDSTAPDQGPYACSTQTTPPEEFSKEYMAN